MGLLVYRVMPVYSKNLLKVAQQFGILHLHSAIASLRAV